jgi:hypothetical protein
MMGKSLMMSKKTFLLALMSLMAALAASSLFARPEPEDEVEGGRRSLFLLVEDEAADNEIYISRFLLPSSLSLFAWSDFEVRDGEVSMEAEEGFRIRERELEVVGSHGQYRLVKYSFLLSDIGDVDQGRVPAGKRYEVRFSWDELIGKSGDVLYQPARQAAMEAVRMSGKSQGRLKLLSLTLAGDGRFEAEVAVL